MSWEVGHPIKRDGTNQLQRLLDALRPERNPVDDRGVEDFVLFIYRLADQFAYYNENNVVEKDAVWKTFFTALRDNNGKVTLDSIRQYLTWAEISPDNSVFLTILLAFLKMFGYAQQDINTLTQKHLDFYYEQVLGFRRLPPVPDEVHVLFELAPHVRQQRIPAGTALKAGKDALGKPLTYITNREIVANKARLAAIKTTLLTDDGRVFAAEVANSADGLGAPFEVAPPNWPLFGDPDFMQPATVGFAIASPLLLLEEGQRLVDLTLTFEDTLVEITENEFTENEFRQFIPYGSGAESWVKMSHRNKPDLVLLPDKKQVRFYFELDAGQPAIVGYQREKLAGNFDTVLPLLRLTLEPQSWGNSILNNLVVVQADLNVYVVDEPGQSGVQNLILQNDNGILPTGTSIQPFGFAPGKNACFYIGSQEVFGKPLDELIIHLRWADLPEDDKGFAGYYEGYPAGFLGKGNEKYTVVFQTLSMGRWSNPVEYNNADPDGPGSELFLFEPHKNPSKKLEPDRWINLKRMKGELPFTFVYELPAEIDQYDKSVKGGFIRLFLNQDFGHKWAKPSLNPPYTPTLQSISLGYKSSQTITPGREQSDGRFFYVQPFGSDEPFAKNGVPLLPTLSRAALYLGFAGLEPPQNLHLLFQIAEGSGESTDTIRAEDMQWHYLTDQGWCDTALADSEIFIDTTLGLQKSGIMAFQIGQDAGKNAMQMPGGLHWLRASLPKKAPLAAARAITIHTQAITAVFHNNDNDPAHLLRPLSAGAINALAERNSAVRKVEQPYASFNGIPAEQNEHFYTRVSERLRHKQRAVTLWDIERLTLERFPALFEVKAISHTGLDKKNAYSEFQPGQVTVVLVPQLRNPNAANPLQPRVSAAILEEVRRFLQPLSTPFVGGIDKALHVVHPRYEQVLLSFSVGFHTGFDAGYYAGVLQESLRRRLSPWAYEEGEDIRFNGRVYKSQLLTFVEEQEYVDYVTDFKMVHILADPGIGDMTIVKDFFVRPGLAGEDLDVATASTAASVLVSADKHLIRVLRPDDFPCEKPDEACAGGIGCWFINIDFLVSEQ